jgi:hypothetical protein
MLQLAASRTPKYANPMDVPMPFCEPRMYILVQTVSVGSVAAELVIGFSLYRWLGLLIWLPFIPAANLIFQGKNPGPCFFVGILVVTLGAVLLAIA